MTPESISRFLIAKDRNQDLAQSTVDMYNRICLKFLNTSNKDIPIGESFQSFMDRPVKRSTIKLEGGVVAEFLKFCGEDVSTAFQAYSIGRREHETDIEHREALCLSKDEIDRLLTVPLPQPGGILKYVPSFYLTRNDLIRKMLYASGMRVNELVKMDRGWLCDNHAVIPVSANKTSRSRVVDLMLCRDALDLYLTCRVQTGIKDEALFLSNYGTRMTEKSVRDVINKITKLAGVYRKGRSCHKLRHRRITELVSGGVPAMLVAKTMGNSVRTIETVYYNPTADDLLREVRKSQSLTRHGESNGEQTILTETR